jgi:hypothetical protein
MSTITRSGFVGEFSGQAIDTRSLPEEVRRELQKAGVDQVMLDQAAGADGVIDGRDWGSLFERLERRDHDGSRETIDAPASLLGALRDEIARQRSAARPSPAPPAQTAAAAAARPAEPATYIYDRTTHTRTLVDARAYEAERANLQRQLKHLLTAIPEDRRAVLKEYPFEAVKEMYGEAEEALKHAVSYYQRGDLLMAGAWARKATQFTGIEAKAHRIMMDEGLASYMGKRLAAAGVGILEGSAGMMLDMIDKGAGLVGVKPGLAEWNARQYDKIQNGLSGLTGIDGTQTTDRALGKLGGGLATGLAVGKGFKDAGALGQTVLAVTSVGGAAATIDAIKDLRARGASWGAILSDPANIAKIAGAVGAFTGAAGNVPALKSFCDQVGLVTSAAEMAALSTAIVQIKGDPNLSEQDRNQKLLDTLGKLLGKAAKQADKQFGKSFDAWMASRAPAATTATSTTGAPAPAPGATPTPRGLDHRFDFSDVQVERGPARK